MRDVRCPVCDKLLAKEVRGGVFEIRVRGGVLVARIVRGTVHCSACNTQVRTPGDVFSTR